MMIVQMDKMSAHSSSSERAQRLYDRNIELENKRRKSAQARLPSDPNAWQQIRENYESIILEDHGFSEQHNVEYALWQLHYRHIEELRAQFNAALASAGSNTSHGAKVPARPDQITKIRLQFKTFLSEATGFYHDLILKIRSKFGLPLGYFSEGSDNRIVTEKDGKRSDMKKGLISCHRCLIYLGDLARYKGLYGDNDSKKREYSAASSYYLEAASLWPSSGNPHHQLAILASYSGDELVAVYRYFRSLAVDNPFTTARDNLIVAFEKNRQNYSQLVGGVKASGLKESSVHMNGRVREKVNSKAPSKEPNLENGTVKEKTSNIHDMLKSFCTRFVRLNGILFTRTSLETFSEVLASTNSEFCELLSSVTEEQLNFGVDAVENGLFIIRLVCILIFTVHNVKREAEGQTYAEIVQRAVLLQNAFTATFEFAGCILERCLHLQDPSTSYFLPGILVFVEWLASCPDVASSSDMDEKQAAVRLKFWNYFISVMNKVLSACSIFVEDDDETCFSNMTRYEEGETKNRIALWEDFELRGFLPLLPAQTILDFSRKQALGNDRCKEKMARIKRILAAAKALASIVKLDQKTIFFDSKMKKFIIGAEYPFSDDSMLTKEFSMPESNDLMQESQHEKTMNLGLQTKIQPYMGGDDEDEVIVFKPPAVENRNDLATAAYEGLKPIQNASFGDLNFLGGSVSEPLDTIRQQVTFDAMPQVSASVGTMASKHVQQPIQAPASKWFGEQAASLANSLNGVKFMENGHSMEHEMQKGLSMKNSYVQQFPIQNLGNLSSESMFYSQTNPSKVDAVAISGVAAEMASKMPSSLASGARKNPVSRPVRHLGPPPGFNSVPSKQLNESALGSDLTVQNPLMDDYSWLDGYQLSTKASGFNNFSSAVTHPTSQYMSNSNGFTGNAVSFPFPGKQIPPVQSQADAHNGWQNYQALDHLRVQQEQQLQQQLMNGNQQLTSMPEQYPGQSIWSSRYMV